MNGYLLILKHDLHKLFPSLYSHSCLNTVLEKKADSMASFFSRNFLKEKFSPNYIRLSFINGQSQISKNDLYSKKILLKELFSESNPVVLHSKILNSKILNLFSESRTFPYTSLKYHILLTCAFYYNLKMHNNRFTQYYLYENIKPESEFQIIYSNKDVQWCIMPKNSYKKINKNIYLGPIYPNFGITWMRRMKSSIIGGDRFLDNSLSQIPSWSCGLSYLEDYMDLYLKINNINIHRN
ncbi:MAG: hypothetical protein ACTSPY_17465 [Candidatus Helarchaeota archaeon]